MTNEEKNYFQRSFSELNTKLDNLYDLIIIIGNEVGIQRGMRLADQITQILDSVRATTHELNAAGVRNMPYKMTEVVKSIEYINNKIR